MKIMFICTGNICRSAMAHKLMEKKVKDNNLKNIEIYSCRSFCNRWRRTNIQCRNCNERL